MQIYFTAAFAHIYQGANISGGHCILDVSAHAQKKDDVCK